MTYRWLWVLWSLLLLPTLTWATLPAGELWREQLLNQRVGYGRLATGGAGGTLCTVSNLNGSGAGSLLNCLLTAGAQWIIFSVSGTINMNTQLNTGDNPSLSHDKTIDGRGADITLDFTNGGRFLISGVHNWIIHNVKAINQSGDFAGAFNIRILCSKTIWIDHYSTTGGGTQTSIGIGYAGGNCYGPDNLISADITISWSKFHDFCYMGPGTPVNCASGHILFAQGSNSTTAPPDEPLMAGSSLTLHHNWYQPSAALRFPLMRYGRLHSFNNYMDNTDGGIDVRASGRAFSENDIFQCDQYGHSGNILIPWCGHDQFYGNRRVSCGVAVAPTDGELAGSNCKVTNPWLVTGTETYEQVNPGTTFDPAADYSYSSVLETANAALRSKITDATTGAGAVSNPYNYLAVGTDALVGWWKLDASSGTTAVDSSGNALDGTLVNMESPGDWVQGIIGNVAGKGALQFDGTNEYVTIPDNDVLSPVTTGEFSVCAWVLMPSTPTDFATIVAKGTASNYEYAFDLDTAQHVLFVLWTATGSPEHASVLSSTTVPLNTWTYVCGTYANGVETKVYLNGALSGTSTTFTGVMTNGTSPVNIGRRPDDIEYLNARVDDVRLFNYALTDAQIDAILAEGFDVVYHLNESASPAADSGQPGLYNGTWQNSPTPVVTGKVSGALSFNGSNQYVSVAVPPSLVGAATVALWVKLTTLTATNTLVSNADVANANTQGALNINSDGSWNYLYELAGIARIFGSNVGQITVGSWIHLAATDDGAGNVQLYQAGSPITTAPFGTVTAKPDTAPGLLALGRAGGASLQYTNGAMDEVHVVSRVMSASEILALAQEGSDVTAPAAPTSLRVVSP